MSSPFDAPVNVDGFSVRRSLRLKRIGVLSVAIFSAAMGAALGLIAGLMLFLYAGLGAAQVQGGNQMNWLAGFGIAGLIVVPLLYGMMGFIGGAINALIYNVIAGLTGGIELEFGE